MNAKILLFFRLLPLLALGLSRLAGQTQNDTGASQEYQGPSILSRDRTLIGERGGKLADFRYFASVTGVYDSNLTAVSTNSNGNVNSGGSEGVDVGFGASLAKTWRRDSLSLQYSGAFRDYKHQYFSGIDQFLNLRYGRILKRRLTLDANETAGVTGLGNGSFSYLPLTSSALQVLPSNELFDNRTYYSQSRVGLTWQKTNRLSFAISGDDYLIRRRSASLAGLDGVSVHGDVAYRLTRRQTVSMVYGYSHYSYQRTFGGADVQSLGLGYAFAFSRRMDAAVNVGGSLTNVDGIQSVNVDPAIVAIIGQATISQTFHRTVAVPNAEARLNRRFNRSTLGINAITGVSPGNGVYLTSRQNAVGADYSYSGRRRWTYAAKFQYTELSTIGQSIGKYSNYNAGTGMTYKLSSVVHAQLRYDYRHYTTQNNTLQKDSHRISLGFAFSPASKPLSIW